MKEINGDDYRDQPLRLQTEMIIVGVKGLHAANSTDELESKISSLNNDIEALKQTNVEHSKSFVEVKNTNSSLTQQLTRSESHIATLEIIIKTYKQQLDTATTALEIASIDDTLADPEANAKLEAEAKPEANAKLEAEAKAKLEAEAKAKLEAEAKAKLEAEAKTKLEAEAKPEAEAKTKLEAEAKTEEVDA